MYWCVLCAHDFDEAKRGCVLYDRARRNNPNRDFYQICDECFMSHWRHLHSIDKQPFGLIYLSPELVYNKIFEEKGWTPRRKQIDDY